MFTNFFLQEEMAEELRKLFSKDRFPDRNGKLTALSVYEQFLPITDAGQGEDSQEDLENGFLREGQGDIPVPYIQVILPTGRINTVNKPGTTNLLLYLCVYDDGKERKGYQYLINMIHRICERFQENICLGNYQCREEIVWELSDEDDHPFYFGAISMEFNTPTIKKEDRYC